jgi:hypothetical protein
MMTVQFTCQNCGSGIHVYPESSAHQVECDVCKTKQEVTFNQDHETGNLLVCPGCQRQDFYSQKDFNRKIGVIFFVLAAIISTILLYFGVNPLWYLSTFIFLYALDFILFKRLKAIAICYKCQAVFRDVKNIDEIPEFDHEMNDRIIYSDHDFHGKPLDH